MPRCLATPNSNEEERYSQWFTLDISDGLPATTNASPSGTCYISYPSLSRAILSKVITGQTFSVFNVEQFDLPEAISGILHTLM